MPNEQNSRQARLWVRNAVAELTVAINEASQALVTEDDNVAHSYTVNVRIAMTKAQDYITRARIMLEGDQ